MVVASPYEDRAPGMPGPGGVPAGRWIKPAGVLAGAFATVAVGVGALLAAQASSWEIVAPTFSTAKTETAATDVRLGGPQPYRGSAAAGPSTPSGAPTIYAHARSPSAASGFRAGLTDGVMTLVDATQEEFAEAQTDDEPSPLAAATRGQDSGSASGFQSFAG